MNDFSAFIKIRNNCTGNNCWLHIVFILMLLISCNPLPGEKNLEGTKQQLKDTLYPKPPGSFTHSTVIDFAAAVFYNPDSLQLIKIKTITSPAIFDATMHEFFYQMRNSRMVLKKYYPHIKIIEVTNARYLYFIQKDGKKEIIDLNTKKNPCGLFIFDGQKAPQLADMTNIETDLGFYFAK